ncbi:hypothetical protein H2201_007406 [Coniosporium apollinis]|uniref:Gfo/Idh/MocA-like oxidoreductase N-terminal domain-containing protein n=1 Tax=Coniosporium apollinis TaxID=61459 RepID=A0ABQ9NP98_9PEZI|nr:hypothetical protein H2201_007406 [Coniosporium apollinis]
MINFGCIGTGWITASFVNSAQATGKWKLAAVYSRRAETAKEFGAKFDVTTVHTSIESLAKDGDIQAVYIASPNSLHYEQAKVILAAKKHVIIEKPATSTVAEFEELYALAKDQGVFLLEANRHIQEINFKVLQQNLSKLGPIYGASLTYASYSSRYNNVLAGETPNIFSLEYSGGALVDLGVYPISFAVALFGKPKSQSYSPVIIATGADGGGLITLQYEGFGVAINASKCYTSTAPSEVYGEKGTFVINAVTDIERVTFLDAKSKQKEELAKEKAKLNLQEEAEEFARIIDGGDGEAAKRLEELSRIVIGITTDLRRQCGLVFAVEKL